MRIKETTHLKKELEIELRNAFLDAYKTAAKLYNFSSPIFIRMLDEHGAYETAKRLTSNPNWQKGYEKLASYGRTDLTVEHIIQQDKYASYFSDQELFNAKEKIQAAQWMKGRKY